MKVKYTVDGTAGEFETDDVWFDPQNPASEKRAMECLADGLRKSSNMLGGDDMRRFDASHGEYEPFSWEIMAKDGHWKTATIDDLFSDKPLCFSLTWLEYTEKENDADVREEQFDLSIELYDGERIVDKKELEREENLALPAWTYYGEETAPNGEKRTVFTIADDKLDTVLIATPSDEVRKTGSGWEIAIKDNTPLWPSTAGEVPEREEMFEPVQVCSKKEIAELVRKMMAHVAKGGVLCEMGAGAKYGNGRRLDMSAGTLPLSNAEKINNGYLVDFEEYGKVKYPAYLVKEHPVKNTIDIKGLLTGGHRYKVSVQLDPQHSYGVYADSARDFCDVLSKIPNAPTVFWFAGETMDNAVKRCDAAIDKKLYRDGASCIEWTDAKLGDAVLINNKALKDIDFAKIPKRDIEGMLYGRGK